ncbi:CBS domain-containing protein [Litoribacillus peritrichatus]|uniref:CBS domain-containing protein n=1 Tax=Litoribacillus peritrichatus TaxID=718191 RepID=A0ABP7MR03_9GAMM
MIIKNYMSSECLTLKPNSTLAQARELMETRRVRQLPVVDAENRLVGILSKRDIYAASVSVLSKNYEREKKLIESHISVEEIMTRDVRTVSPNDDLASAALTLQEMRVGALPVVEDGKLIGIISNTDFLGIAVMLLEK